MFMLCYVVVDKAVQDFVMLLLTRLFMTLLCCYWQGCS